MGILFCGVGCQHGYTADNKCLASFDVSDSFKKALLNPQADTVEGGAWYFDTDNLIFWTWDTPQFIAQKFDKIINRYGLGGIMAWSLGEDSYSYDNLVAMQDGFKTMKGDDIC